MPYFSLRFILIFTLFLVHQFKAKDIPVLALAPLKYALNKKGQTIRLAFFPNECCLYSYSCLCLLAQ